MWAWVAYTVEGQALGELTLARDRKLGFDVRGAATATWTLDGDITQGYELEELRADLFVWHDEELMFRGRINAPDDALDADRHTTSWSAVDYRGLLGARLDPTGHVYEGWSQSDIAWNLIQAATAWDGGDLGITRGTQRPAAVTRSEAFEADIAIDKALERFEGYADGFEWWIAAHPDGTQTFEAATWRGVRRDDFPIAWGTTATSLKRTVDTGLFANWVRVRGGTPERDPESEAEPVAPYADRWATDLATRREGRIMRVVTDNDLTTQPQVDAAAEQLLADSLTVPAAYTATLAPGIWRRTSDLWLGDICPLRVRSGRLDDAVDARVNQLDISLDEEGNDTVEVTLGHG